MQRHLRLRQTEDFAHLRAAGKVWRHPFVSLSVAANGLTHNRYGFITSRQLGKAVVRNRVRRVLREAVRQLHPQLAGGHDLALIARAPIVGQPSSEVQRALVGLAKQAELWKPTHEGQA